MRKSIVLWASFIFLIGSGMLISNVFSARSAVAEADLPELRDIGSHWAEAAIQTAVEKKYISGFGDGTFRPDAAVTREQFVRMLVSAKKYGLCACKEQEGFKDLEEDRWSTVFIRTAVQQGVILPPEFPTEEYEPAREITREEMAIMANRTLGVDVPLEDSLYEAVKSGLLVGYEDGSIGPERTLTRAEAVTVIERILKVDGGGKLPVDRKVMERMEVAKWGSNMETLTGIQFRKFPWVLEYPTFTLSINKVLVFNPTMPDTAYYEMFKNAVVNDRSGDTYYFALDIEVTNKVDERNYIGLRQSIDTAGYGRPVKEDWEKNKYRWMPSSTLFEKGEREQGYIIIGYPESFWELHNSKIPIKINKVEYLLNREK